MSGMPWDPPGLPPVPDGQRCTRHSHCAYREDDPTRCRYCHRDWTVVTGRDGQTRRAHTAEHQRTAAAEARRQERRTPRRKRGGEPLEGRGV